MVKLLISLCVCSGAIQGQTKVLGNCIRDSVYPQR